MIRPVFLIPSSSVFYEAFFCSRLSCLATRAPPLSHADVSRRLFCSPRLIFCSPIIVTWGVAASAHALPWLLFRSRGAFGTDALSLSRSRRIIRDVLRKPCHMRSFSLSRESRFPLSPSSVNRPPSHRAPDSEAKLAPHASSPRFPCLHARPQERPTGVFF